MNLFARLRTERLFFRETRFDRADLTGARRRRGVRLDEEGEVVGARERTPWTGRVYALTQDLIKLMGARLIS